MQLAEELLRSSHVGVNLFGLAATLELASHAFLVLGKRQRAETVWDELRVLAERTSQVLVWIVSAAMDAVLAVMDGRLEDALDMARHIRARGEEAGALGNANTAAAMSTYKARLHLHRNLEAHERGLRVATEDGERTGPTGVGVLHCLVLAHLGRKDEVAQILEKWVVMRPGIGTPDDLTFTYYDTLLLEAAVLTDHHRTAELLLKRFTGTGVCTSGIWFITCIPRHMGGAAALLERYDESRQHYQEAIRICTKMRFRPEMALTRLEVAGLLLNHYPQEKSEAIAHLDFVIPEFRDMKMNTYLERALRHKEILKA